MKANIKLPGDRRLLPLAGVVTTGAALTGVALAIVRGRNGSKADPEDELIMHIGDMMTLNAFVLGEVEGHLEDAKLRSRDDEREFEMEIRRTIMRQNEELQRELEILGGTAPSKMKAAVGALAGIAASMGERLLYRRMQGYPVSRMVRDDYTMLSAISVSLTMLHATARAMHRDGLTEVTERHMREIAELVVRASRQVPRTVVAELSAGPLELDASVGDAAAESTKQAWLSVER